MRCAFSGKLVCVRKHHMTRSMENSAVQTLGLLLQLAPHVHAVRVLSESQECKKDDVFERAEEISTRHMFYTIKLLSCAGNIF